MGFERTKTTFTESMRRESYVLFKYVENEQGDTILVRASTKTFPNLNKAKKFADSLDHTANYVALTELTKYTNNM